METAAPPSPQPAVAKGDMEEEWLTGVLGGEAHFLFDITGTNYCRNGAADLENIWINNLTVQSAGFCSPSARWTR